MAETSRASLGFVTSYGAARRGGYTGTYEEWCELMATVADHLEENRSIGVGAAEAKAAAEAAQLAAETAQGKAEDAQDAAEDAQTGAEAARTGAETAESGAEAAQTAAEAARDAASGYASAASGSASQAAGSADNAALVLAAVRQAGADAVDDVEAAKTTAVAAVEEAAEAITENVGQIQENKADISDLKTHIDEIATFETGPNLLDPDSFIEGKRIGTSGYLQTGASYKMSNIISVDGLPYIAIYMPFTTDPAKMEYYAFSTDDSFSELTVGENHGTLNSSNPTAVIAVPEGAKYFAFGFQNSTRWNAIKNHEYPYPQVQAADSTSYVITDFGAYGDATAILNSIVQTTGQNTDKIMSQKAVTDALASIPAYQNLASYQLENKAVHEYLPAAETAYSGDDDYSDSIVNSGGYGVQYASGFYARYTGAVRKDHPNPVRIAYNNSGMIATGVWISETSDFSKYLYFKAENGIAEIFNLIPGKTYYYKVFGVSEAFAETVIASGSFTTTGIVRMCLIEGVQNVRDLGGWSALNGNVIYGKLYRGSELQLESSSDTTNAHIYNSGIDVFKEILGIKAELDMTGHTQTESVAGKDIVFRQIMLSSYATVINDADYQAKFKQAFEWILEQITGNKPVYFHCAGGCDRTGTLSALLLGLLGVSEVDMSIEYELSAFSKIGWSRRRNSTSYDYKGMIAAVKTAGNSNDITTAIYNWAVDVVGISSNDIASFRSAMIA